MEETLRALGEILLKAVPTFVLVFLLYLYLSRMFFRPLEEVSQVYCYTVKALDQSVHGRGDSHLALGRLNVRSQLTWNEAETSFVVIHYGGLDFHAVLRRAAAPWATGRRPRCVPRRHRIPRRHAQVDLPRSERRGAWPASPPRDRPRTRRVMERP